MKLKVTVAFGTTRVIVPCGDGHVSVRDLTEAAILRYRKATNKPPDSWVTVHKLQSLADGGILDPDDALVDVVDDKDQILAIYDEQDPVPPTDDVCILPSSTSLNNGGGGSSPSLDGASTASPIPAVSSGDAPERPLIAQRPARALSKSVTFPAPAGVENSVEITSLRDPPTSGLTVRQDADRIETNGFVHSFSRGKRPAPPPPPPAFPTSMSEHSGLVLGRSSSVIGADDGGPRSPLDSQQDGGRLSAIGMGKFDRGSARKSRLADKWLDAAEKVWDDRERQEPIGKEQSREPSPTDADTLTLRIGGAAGQPLGVQVAPEYGAAGKYDERPPLIEPFAQSPLAYRLASVALTQIHEGGRAAVDGRLRLGDRVIEINNRPVYQMSAVRAQTYLHELTNNGEILLKVVRPLRANELATSSKTATTTTTTTKKSAQSALQQANTTKIGATKTIDLRKDSRGLGFTVTSRDTASGERLFYIKTVMPLGVALEDGRLKAGDRLLEINGQPVTGLTQREVVEKLRLFTVGQVVSLLVSRQEDDNAVDHQQNARPPSAQRVASPSQPRQLPADSVNADPLDGAGHLQRLAFDIALNDTGSAGLGVSVKGRTELTTEDDKTTKQNDCGIFIKTIMHGGAAHKDGRLHMNDQLIAIDGIDLLNKTNSEAMRLIGQTMQRIGPTAASIRLDVFRAVSTSEDNDADAQRSVQSAIIPSDEGESLYLDILRKNASRQSNNVVATAASTVPRVTVVGYGDYATIVRNQSDGQEKPMIVDDREGEYGQPSTSRPAVQLYEDIDEFNAERADRVAEEEYDAFVREAPTRRSMSEKRHLGAKNDPSHTVAYQRIKHQRQTSAPTLAGESAVIVSPPESPRPVARFRSASKGVARSNSPQVRRRSISLESMGASPPAVASKGATAPPPVMMIHEIAARSSKPQTSGADRKSVGPAMKKVQRARPTNDSFRQAVDRSYAGTGKENAIDVSNTSPIPEEPQGSSPVMRANGHHSLPRQVVNKDKQRRKSVGSTLFSKGWFRFGSGRSREASPEKTTVLSDSEAETRERAKRANEEENARIREQYEKLKKQQTTSTNGKHLGPSANSAPSLRTHGPPLVPRLVPSPRVTRREPQPAPALPHAPPPSYYAHLHSSNANGHAQRMSRAPPYSPMPLQMQAEMHPVPPPHGYDGNGYEDYAYAPWFVRAENSRFYRSLDRGGRIHRSDMGWHRPTLLSDDTNNIDTLRYTAPPPVANQERGRLRASSELSPPAQYSTKATPLTTTPSTPISPTLTEARRPLSPSNSLLHRHRHHRQYSTDDSARRRPNPHPDGSQTLHHPSRTTSAAMRSTNNSSTTNGRVGGSRSSSRPAAPELAAVDFDYRRLLRPVKRMPAVNKPAPPPPSHSSRPISNYADYRRPHLPTTTTPYDWPIMENDAPAYC